MKRKFEIISALLILAMLCPVFAAKKDGGKSKSKAKAKRDVDSFVYSKYATPSNTPDMAGWGTLNCHDPKIFQDDDGTYYVYSTDASIGGMGRKGLQIRKSTDLVHWTCLPTTAIPQKNWDKAWLKWVGFDRAGASTWAPTVIKHNGLYYMYHGIITGAEPMASIVMAIASSPEGPFYAAQDAAKKDPIIKKVFEEKGISYKQTTLVRYAYNDPAFAYMDEPLMTEFECYNLGDYDTANQMNTGFSSWTGGFGAIDPEFVTDVSTGKLMEYDVQGTKCYGVTYGSWKGGIALIYVDQLSLKPVDMEGNILDAPADSVEGSFGTLIGGGYGAAYEGAQVIYSSETGYYYLFVSMGNLDWDYRVGVGRSKEITGPYLDASGKSMFISPLSSSGEFHTIGSKIIGSEELKGEYSFRSQGGQSILRTQDGKLLFACHARTNFLPGYFFFLQVHQLFFTESGWPVINGNEYYQDETFQEKLVAIDPALIPGTYDVILTERSDETGDAKFAGTNEVIKNVYLKDGLPTKSKELEFLADGSITGELKGSWKLAEDGYTVKISLDGTGDFDGYFLNAVDWAKKRPGPRKVLSFTTIDTNSGKSSNGEYLWGNKRIVAE